MTIRKMISASMLGAVTMLVFAAAFFSEFFSPSSSLEGTASPPSPNSQRPNGSPAREGLVFDEPEVDLGVVKERFSHRFRYRNASTQPLTISPGNVKGSCSCMVSKPDRLMLQPGEIGSVTLETDISRKEPGAHRFLLFIEYESGGKTATATATVRVAHQPDLFITPRCLELIVTEGTRTTGNLTIIDYRKESLKILKIRSSSPSLTAEMSEHPREYLPGWRHVIQATYTDPANEKRAEFREEIMIETTDPALPMLTVEVAVRRLDRLRLAPQAVFLSPDRHTAVILRDSLGAKVSIATCDTGGLAVASYSAEGESAKKVLLSMPKGTVDPSKYPATIWIQVSKPCKRRLPIKVSLASATRF